VTYFLPSLTVVLYVAELELREASVDLAKASAWRQRTAINRGLGIFGILTHIASSFDLYVDIGGRNLDRDGQLIQDTTIQADNDSKQIASDSDDKCQ
jgi:hypothetical protein